MTKKRLKKKRKVLLRIYRKRSWRSSRSRLNAKLLRGGGIPKKKKKKYKLKVDPQYKIYKVKKLEDYTIKVPKNFCFYKDVKGVNDFLADLRKIMKKRPRNYFIDHEETEVIGLAPSFLFDEIIREEWRYWKEKKIKINFRGKISKYKKVNNFLLSFGVLKLLGITSEKFPPDRVDWDYSRKYLTFELRGNKKKILYSAFASVELVDYFNKCFKYNGMEITGDAKSDLIGRIGEIIGNAEEHCGNDIGEWVALGAYDKEDHICHFAIINYGNSIYQSLSDENSTAADVLEKVQKVILSNKPLWEKANRIFKKEDEEPIWNVMALQDGVSSKRTATGKSSSRGQGLMDVLSFIQFVKAGKDGAIICLLSGRSVINIDYEYPIVERPVGHQKENRRMIIFNKKQELHEPSDDKKVMSLENNFPGTIFTGSFKIDAKYLRQVLDGSKAKNN